MINNCLKIFINGIASEIQRLYHPRLEVKNRLEYWGNTNSKALKAIKSIIERKNTAVLFLKTFEKNMIMIAKAIMGITVTR